MSGLKDCTLITCTMSNHGRHYRGKRKTCKNKTPNFFSNIFACQQPALQKSQCSLAGSFESASENELGKFFRYGVQGLFEPPLHTSPENNHKG